MLFVSFWHVGLENIPEGTFTHRRVSPKEAKQMIDEARSTSNLRGVSQDNLLAPHDKHEAENHKALCRVLAERHEIALSIKDFVLKDEFEDDGGYTIHPLQFAEINESSGLMIVNCHYEMASRQRGRSEIRHKRRLRHVPSIRSRRIEEVTRRRVQAAGCRAADERARQVATTKRKTRSQCLANSAFSFLVARARNSTFLPSNSKGLRRFGCRSRKRL